MHLCSHLISPNYCWQLDTYELMLPSQTVLFLIMNKNDIHCPWGDSKNFLSVLNKVGSFFSHLIIHINDYQVHDHLSLPPLCIIALFRDDGNCCCTLWRMVMWFDNWKKSILYIIISIPEFLKGWSSYLAVISGKCLDYLSGVLPPCFTYDAKELW